MVRINVVACRFEPEIVNDLAFTTDKPCNWKRAHDFQYALSATSTTGLLYWNHPLYDAVHPKEQNVHTNDKFYEQLLLVPFGKTNLRSLLVA